MNLCGQLKGRIFVFILIAMVVMAIFFPMLSYGWLGIEDTSYYQTNPLFGPGRLLDRLLACWFHSPDSNYMPLTWSVTVLLDDATSHSPQAFHAFSLGLHLLNSLLVFILLSRLKLRLVPTVIVVLIFALHPLRVEAVVWASSIKGLLATCFALGAILVQMSPKIRYRSTLMIGFFLLSLLSKQTLFLLPCVHFLLASALPEYRLKKVTYVGLGVLSMLGAVAAMNANAGNSLLAVNQFIDGRVAPLKSLSALGHYFKMQFFPYPLFPEYPANQLWWQVLIGVLCLFPVGGYVRSFFSSERPSLAVSLYVCFIVLIFPTLGFVTTPLEFAADRLSYLPSLFFWAALVLVIAQSCSMVWCRRVFSVTALLFIGFLVALTHRQLSHWKSDSALIAHILHHEPEHYLANLHLANKLALAGDFKNALPVARTITEVHPHRYGGQQTLSGIYLSMESPAASLEALEICLSRESPITADLYLLRCGALRALGRYVEALKSCDLAKRNGMDLLTVHYHRALTYHDSGEEMEAQDEIEQALSIDPQSLRVLRLKVLIESGNR